jgi:hypothetical protein
MGVLSMILFASVGVGLFLMNRQAENDEAAKHGDDSRSERIG